MVVHIRPRALTLTEVIVVLAVGGLLTFIALPALAGVRVNERAAWCCANLRQIGVASLTYADEDPREQIVPLHQSKVRPMSLNGFFNSEWAWRTAEPMAYGGRTPITDFPGGGGTAMRSKRDGGNGFWVASTRPLNLYALGWQKTQETPFEVFHCPADVGYPDADWVQDAPREVAGIPCFDFLGNSYRVNTCGIGFGSPQSIQAEFLSAPVGHRASSIASRLSETVLYAEPLFYNGSRTEHWNPPPDFVGWHGQFRADQVVFCDGSAALRRLDPFRVFSRQELEQMNFSIDFIDEPEAFLRRGPSYQMDCYPTPGARIDRYRPNGTPLLPGPLGYTGWPFDGYQQNVPPGSGDGPAFGPSGDLDEAGRLSGIPTVNPY